MKTLEIPKTYNLELKIKTWRNLIEQALAGYLPFKEEHPQASIHEAMRYSTLCKGHRYRPVLFLSVADAFGMSLVGI